MADVTYKIIIEAMGVDGGGAGVDKPRSVAVTPKGDEISPVEKAYSGFRALKTCAPVAYALKYVNKATTTGINLVALRTGRTTYQEQLQWTYSTALKGLAIAGSIVGGVATGNPTLIIGGAMAAVDTFVDYSISAENIRLERRVENISMGMANVRAGAGGNRNSN